MQKNRQDKVLLVTVEALSGAKLFPLQNIVVHSNINRVAKGFLEIFPGFLNFFQIFESTSFFDHF